MEKANKISWRVKMRHELDLAESETDPEKATIHRDRARKFAHLANEASPPDPPPETDFP
jgi:hypothetical protein